MQCVATSAVGTGCNLKLLQELPSKNYDDGECVNVTFFVLVMALPSPSICNFSERVSISQ